MSLWSILLKRFVVANLRVEVFDYLFEVTVFLGEGTVNGEIKPTVMADSCTQTGPEYWLFANLTELSELAPHFLPIGKLQLTWKLINQSLRLIDKTERLKIMNWNFYSSWYPSQHVIVRVVEGHVGIDNDIPFYISLLQAGASWPILVVPRMDCAWDLHTTYSIRNWKDSYVTELSTCLNLVTPLVLKIKSLKKPIGEVVKVDLIWYLV